MTYLSKLIIDINSIKCIPIISIDKVFTLKMLIATKKYNTISICNTFSFILYFLNSIIFSNSSHLLCLFKCLCTTSILNIYTYILCIRFKITILLIRFIITIKSSHLQYSSYLYCILYLNFYNSFS